MNEHRRNLETRLNNYDTDNPSVLRIIGTSIVAPIGFVLAPVIVAGYLAGIGGMVIYTEIREHYNKKGSNKTPQV